MNLSIIVPCYDEAKNIPLILEGFKKGINNKDVEVILVNNGSTDNTAEVLKELLPRYPFARSVLVPVNQGYGYGILQGLHAAEGKFLGWTHADMQTDPEDVLKAYDILENKKWDVNMYVKGNRKGRSLTDYFFTFGMGVFESFYLGKSLFDINAQPNIFSRDFFEKWKNPPYDFALDLYAFYMARVNGMNVVRFPVQFPPRIFGASHWNTGLKAKWQLIKRIMTFSRNMKKAGIR